MATAGCAQRVAVEAGASGGRTDCPASVSEVTLCERTGKTAEAGRPSAHRTGLVEAKARGVGGLVDGGMGRGGEDAKRRSVQGLGAVGLANGRGGGCAGGGRGGDACVRRFDATDQVVGAAKGRGRERMVYGERKWGVGAPPPFGRGLRVDRVPSIQCGGFHLFRLPPHHHVSVWVTWGYSIIHPLPLVRNSLQVITYHYTALQGITLHYLSGAKWKSVVHPFHTIPPSSTNNHAGPRRARADQDDGRSGPAQAVEARWRMRPLGIAEIERAAGQ